MKILHIIADGSVGGGATHVLQLLTRTHKMFECGLVTQQNSHLATQASRLRVPVFELGFSGSRFKPLLPLRLSAILSEFAPDVVHVHGGRAGFFLSLVRNGRPVVYTLHGLHCAHKQWPMRILGACAERLVMQRANHVIFVADYDRRQTTDLRLLPKDRKHSVIYNGIHPEEIPHRKEPRWDLAFVGRLTTPKDPLLFLSVIALLPTYSGVIVGAGNLEQEVRATIKKRNLDRRVEMKGALSREDTLAVLAQTRVLVMTSRWEALPIVALEAMAAGVPVVAPSVGGLPEILSGGNGGLLVQRTPRDIANGVIRILKDPDLAAQLTEAGRKRLHENFTEEVMFKKLLEVYERTLERCSVTFKWLPRKESEMW